MIRSLLRQLHWPSFAWALAATAVLAVLIVVGSRNLADFDSALIGYTFACLFSWFGLVYRYSVWLTKPPTNRYWRRGWQLLFAPSRWRRARRAGGTDTGVRNGTGVRESDAAEPPAAGSLAPARAAERIGMLLKAVWSRILWQDFILKRGFRRWLGHMLLAWGCVVAGLVTFPLVFGWIHFEQGAIEPEPLYKVMIFGFHVQDMPLRGLVSWLTFHALIISSFMVIAGIMIVMSRRMFDMGAVAVERFGRDLLPLILLFGIAASGLLLWVSYEWFNGQFYNALAQFHAIMVIALLISLPFGKLFHIFQRPASLGVVFYRSLGEREGMAVCPVTGEQFASQLQTEDLNEVLPELGFDYMPVGEGPQRGGMIAADEGQLPQPLPAGGELPVEPTGDSQTSRVPNWNEISPQGRRMLIARAHDAVRRGRFD